MSFAAHVSRILPFCLLLGACETALDEARPQDAAAGVASSAVLQAVRFVGLVDGARHRNGAPLSVTAPPGTDSVVYAADRWVLATSGDAASGFQIAPRFTVLGRRTLIARAFSADDVQIGEGRVVVEVVEAPAPPPSSPPPSSPPPSSPPPSTGGSLRIVADTDRDGDIDDADLDRRGTFSWSRGAFLLANLDDDDRDGRIDATDDVVNGDADAADLARVRVAVDDGIVRAASRLEITVTRGAAATRVYVQEGARWSRVGGPITTRGQLTLGLEATRFAGAGFDGLVRLRVRALDGAGAARASDEIELRVAPFLMLPSSATARVLHVATGVYDNADFLTDLRSATAAAGVTLATPYRAPTWQAMWNQDTMEIGYTQLPGQPPMHVALRANRGHDGYARTLLGPGMGYLEVGSVRGLTGGDAWADWYGNLEVSPPVPGWPLGRIYYGLNTVTGEQLNPEVVAFLEAQELQAPFPVDTSWLLIKHVDEILTFVPDQAGRAKLLVSSPREAGRLYPSYYGPYNQGLQARIDAILHGTTYTIRGRRVVDPGVLARLGLTRADVVELPLFYTDGHNDWSNPLNGVWLGNGIYIAGNTDMLAPERDLTASRLAALGVQVRWVRDAPYQHRSGNVHCATNATRTPVVTSFAGAIPPGL